MGKMIGLAFLLACTLPGLARAEPPAGWFAAGTAPDDYEMGSMVGKPDLPYGDTLERISYEGRIAYIRAKRRDRRDDPAASVQSTPSDRSRSGRGATAQAGSDGFGTMMQTFDATSFKGKRVRLSGLLRTQRAGAAQMWMRVDGNGRRALAFDNMEGRTLKGSNEWTRCAIVLDVPGEATSISIGFLLLGDGAVWADDLRFETVGKDVPPTSMQTRRLAADPENLNFSK